VFAASISDVKLIGDGFASPALSDLTCTQSGYIQDKPGIPGIRVENGPPAGTLCDISAGTVLTDANGNRYIQLPSSGYTAKGMASARPVGMPPSAIGGSDRNFVLGTNAGQRGTTGKTGINNVGLYVRTWGDVSYVDPSTFVLSDGAGASVRCTGAASPNWRKAVVTGTIELYKDPASGDYMPALRVASVDVLAPSESVTAPTVSGPTSVAVEAVAWFGAAATDEHRHGVEYRYDWGDGTSSGWTKSRIWHSWKTVGTKSIVVTARSLGHPEVTAVSEPFRVEVCDAVVRTWQPVGGPRNALITCFTFGSGGIVYGNTHDQGICRSTDDGVHWANLGWYGDGSVVTADERIFMVQSHVTLRSDDDGASWVSLGNMGTTLSGDSAGRLYSSGYKSLWVSADCGDHWTVATTPAGVTYWNDIAADASGVVFAATNAGVYRSFDGGLTWLPANNGLGSVYCKCLAVVGDTVYVGTSLYGIFRSINGGNSWTASSSGLPASANIVRLKSDTAGRLFAADSNEVLYRSTDGGATWGPVNGLSVACFGVSPSGALLLSKSSGVLRSMDGGDTLTLAEYGPFGGKVNGLAVDTIGRVYAAGGCIYRTADKGLTWGSLNITGAVATSPSGLLFAAAADKIYRSSDDGATWTACADGLPGGSLYNSYSVAVSPSGTLFASRIHTPAAYVYLHYLYRSTDNGNSWSIVVPEDSGSISLPVWNSARQLFISRSGVVYRSDDDGVTWLRKDSGIPSNLSINTISVSPAGQLYASLLSASSYAQYVFVSTDCGESWTQVGGAAKMPWAFNSDGDMFASDGSGVYRSTDGLVWTAFSDGLVTTRVNRLLLDADGYLYAATDDLGLFRTTTTTLR